MDPKIAKELVKARQAVKEKYRALKSDIAQSETKLQKQWKPISEPLQQLLEKVEPVKVKPENWKLESKTSTPQKSPLSQKLTPTNIYNRYLPTTTSFLEDTFSNLPEHSILQDVSGIEESRPDATVLERERDVDEQMIAHTREEFRRLSKTPGYQSYLEQFHPLPRQYIDESIRGDEENFDRYHGITHDWIGEKLKLGNTPITLEESDIILDNIRYPGTPGLYELLFKKDPRGYKQTDLEHYMDMLKRTNAYRRNFDSNLQIQGVNTFKYKTIIRPYLVKHNLIKVSAEGASKTGFFSETGTS
ncbi:unnamed protein product [Acanthoscelides obtectus]|uniref:DUF8207 domain-containing protein n=1 Tax=Acanthoscelides obtectus TaxID=200917 RepID=A0A9P0KRU2_ACAOB|nr:unnamed protein product [Acanthoscelides obtectus]CAK1641193.1 hypothetical protein AOBTE_LOCUS12226 [Acanthoscelides obtectus]